VHVELRLTTIPKEFACLLACARREQHSAGHNSSWPRAHERRRRVTTPCVRPYQPHPLSIYLCLPHRLFTRAVKLSLLRVLRREQSTNWAPRPLRPWKVPDDDDGDEQIVAKRTRGDRSENLPPACPAVASYGTYNFVSLRHCNTWNPRGWFQDVARMRSRTV